MTREQALEKARIIMGWAPKPYKNRSEKPTTRRIAAALMRAWADGTEYSSECELAAEQGSIDISSYKSPEEIRAVADRLEKCE